MRLLLEGKPQAAYDELAKSVPDLDQRFNSFVNSIGGKSPEQVARDRGIDLSAILNAIGR